MKYVCPSQFITRRQEIISAITDYQGNNGLLFYSKGISYLFVEEFGSFPCLEQHISPVAILVNELNIKEELKKKISQERIDFISLGKDECRVSDFEIIQTLISPDKIDWQASIRFELTPEIYAKECLECIELTQVGQLYFYSLIQRNNKRQDLSNELDHFLRLKGSDHLQSPHVDIIDLEEGELLNFTFVVKKNGLIVPIAHTISTGKCNNGDLQAQYLQLKEIFNDIIISFRELYNNGSLKKGYAIDPNDFISENKEIKENNRLDNSNKTGIKIRLWELGQTFPIIAKQINIQKYYYLHLYLDSNTYSFQYSGCFSFQNDTVQVIGNNPEELLRF